MKKAKAYINPGCIKCGNKKEDLRLGWCYPCFEKAQKGRMSKGKLKFSLSTNDRRSKKSIKKKGKI